ncbi:MAG: hypothetical protein K8H88_05915, partial [Sandaracinaceae bacterium]|nr:hypothetical protein [Sandaracinaceae bacterium]
MLTLTARIPQDCGVWTSVGVVGGAALVVYLIACGVLALFGARWLLVSLWPASRAAGAQAAPVRAHPRVTVQVAICDEGDLIEATLARLAALRYPRERFEVQVCDDSRDPASIAACERGVAT